MVSAAVEVVDTAAMFLIHVVCIKDTAVILKIPSSLVKEGVC